MTPERWSDLETLFGERGAYSGCWCVWWRISRAKFSRNGNRGNRTALKALVNDSTVPGLLAYRGRTGIVSTFRRAGFVEEARPSPRTRIMRKYLA